MVQIQKKKMSVKPYKSVLMFVFNAQRAASLRHFFRVPKILCFGYDLRKLIFNYISEKLGPIVQSVASPTANPGVASWISAWYHTFVEIDHEIISMIILLLQLIQEGLLSVTSKSMCTKYWLTAKSSLPRKKMWLDE